MAMWKFLERTFGTRDSGRGRNDAAVSFRNSGFEIRDSGPDLPAQISEDKRAREETTGERHEPTPSQPSQPVVDVSVPGGESQPVADVSVLEGRVKDALRTVYDPEIPINIYELGLIYDLRLEPTGKVSVQMTLTAPSCPEAQSLPARVEQVIREIPGVTEAKVDLVWDPPWTPVKMSEAARLQLGIF